MWHGHVTCFGQWNVRRHASLLGTHFQSQWMALHLPFSYCCHHGNIWGDEVSVWSMPLFSENTLEANMSCPWVSHLPCDWWNDVITWFQNDESWAAGFFLAFFDSLMEDQHKHLARQLSLLGNTKKWGNRSIFYRKEIPIVHCNFNG